MVLKARIIARLNYQGSLKSRKTENEAAPAQATTSALKMVNGKITIVKKAK